MAVSFSRLEVGRRQTAASSPSAAARAATAFARFPVDEHASVVEAELLGLRGRDSDDSVLERVPRVGGVEPQPELADPELLGEPGAGRAASSRERAAAPEARRPGEGRRSADRRRPAAIDSRVSCGRAARVVDRSSGAPAAGQTPTASRAWSVSQLRQRSAVADNGLLLSSRSTSFEPRGSPGFAPCRAGGQVTRSVIGPVPSASLDVSGDRPLANDYT